MSSGTTSFDDPRDKGKSRDPLVGTVLDGRFHIDDVLGSGGMSVVYLATQIRVNRQVAIKTLKLQLDSKQVYRERFHREIELLCALSHPHIVTVYDCIFDEEQQPYVVMDYLRGRSLEALIKEEGPLNLDRFARICVQVCSALEYAHKNGVVHRDLKPGNLVLMDDEMDFVKVVDFGLAKLSQENRKLTQSGELWGSPPYLSPEQCIGKPEDARSDIYSFGCVMYEMLVGKDPFHNGTTIYELIQYHVNTPPPRMREVNTALQIPDELEAVIFKAMAKDPQDRYQNAQELSNALVKACAGGNSRESGNLKVLTGQISGTHNAQPNSVSIGGAASNFNMALDPMQGMSVEDMFKDRSIKQTTDGGAIDGSKNPPTRQLARDRFSEMEVPKEKPSGAGKFVVIGFVVIIICAAGLFAVASMRSGKGTSAATTTPASTTPSEASTQAATSANTSESSSSNSSTIPSSSHASSAPSSTTEATTANTQTKSGASVEPASNSPTSAKSAVHTHATTAHTTHIHNTVKAKPPAVVKHPPVSKPAAAPPKAKVWDALQGMRSGK